MRRRTIQRGSSWASALSAQIPRDAAPTVPSVVLNDGCMHPVLGFGTYKAGGFVPASASAAGTSESAASSADAEKVVKNAISAGYRFLDCAQFYENEKEIGRAIEAAGAHSHPHSLILTFAQCVVLLYTHAYTLNAGVQREDMYLASKVWYTAYRITDFITLLSEDSQEYNDLCRSGGSQTASRTRTAGA